MYHTPTLSHHRQATNGWQYIGEDDTFVYLRREGPAQLDGFFDDIGNMFKRMVKVTPKSFTPGNIYKGIVNTTLTTVTGGAYLILPKNVKKTLYDVGKVAIPVVAAVAGGAALASANPGLMGTLTAKLSKAGALLGKHANTIGGAVFGFLNKMPPAQQDQVAEQLTPEQIAQIEQGYVSPEVQAMMNQAAQQAYYPPAPPMSLEEAYGAPAPEPPVQAGLFGNGQGMVLFIGLSAVGLVLFGMPRGRR